MALNQFEPFWIIPDHIKCTQNQFEVKASEEPTIMDATMTKRSGQGHGDCFTVYIFACVFLSTLYFLGFVEVSGGFESI